MTEREAEKILSDMLKQIYGFALLRTKTIEDAEDLSQEIVLRAYKTLLTRNDIRNTEKYIWTVAHNMLTNYYRENAKTVVGVTLDEIADIVADPDAVTEDESAHGSVEKLREEIAYLSKIQRKIVIMYYFENRKQAEIAQKLSIPLGTVKWHLFEAKKELKRGINTMRKSGELKFNPIKFDRYGINGSIGTKKLDELFRSALVQNICYAVKDDAKTVNEIAEELGVSPVYIEGEIDALCEQCYLEENDGKYLTTFIIDEPSSKLLVMQDKIYKRAAELFANDLYDALISQNVFADKDLLCGQTDEPLTMTKGVRLPDGNEQSAVNPEKQAKLENYTLYALIPYIAADSELGVKSSITFDEVATVRPDGSHNIFSASIESKKLVLPDDYVDMKRWCGPMWHGISNELILWEIDADWCDRVGPYPVSMQYADEARRALVMYSRLEEDGELSKDEYAWLAERGYIKTCGEPDGMFKSSWQTVQICSKEENDKLLGIGAEIKAKHRDELLKLRQEYIDAVLEDTPARFKKTREFELSHIFATDGWFVLHCMKCLIGNGKLKEPTEGERKTVSRLVINKI